MQEVFFPHSYLTKLTVALAHSFFEHDRNGEPVFLVLLDFGAVISGVGFVSYSQSYISPNTIKADYTQASTIDCGYLDYFDPQKIILKPP